jgi:hypothetical protein
MAVQVRRDPLRFGRTHFDYQGFYWRADEDGRLVSVDDVQPAKNHLRLRVTKEVSWQTQQVVSDDKLWSPIVCVPFLAICFCHYKNVELATDAVPSKVKAKREHGWSPEAWHKLKIEPMRRQLAAAGANQPGGLKRAQSQCLHQGITRPSFHQRKLGEFTDITCPHGTALDNRSCSTANG